MKKKLSKTEKDLMRCEKCGKPFVEAKDTITGKKTGHIFKPDCEHYPKNARFSVG